MPTDTPTGTLLGGRYLLTRPLGAGASATVYLAEDRSLRREVAVKVLRAGLTTDDAFLKRFRAEAVAVAGLNHPHVLRVFDWGEADGTAWLVTEYLAGGSLRGLLNAAGVLPIERVATIGAQAADGLAYAHARGFVHRDVKPSNLLFDDAGRVRIADFGVARALAEAQWTEPTEGLVGTVRYSSPEQALGQPADPRSDVYSLALVLFESATGEVPFVSDSQVATLQARVGAHLPGNPALGPLRDILDAAAAPSLEDRLDAAELWSRLTEVASELTGVARGHGPRHAGAGFTPPTPDELTGTHRAVAPRPVASSRTPRAAVAEPRTGTGRGAEDATVIGAVDATVIGAVPAVASPPEPEAPDEPAAPRRRRGRRVLAVLAVLALVGAGTAAALDRPGAVQRFRLPSYLGHAETSAAAELLARHQVHVVVVQQPSTHVPVGDVLWTRPHWGAWLVNGATIRFGVSAGPPPVAVPTVVGRKRAGAAALLAHVGFTAVFPARLAAYSSTRPAGQVIAVYFGNLADPATAPEGATLALELSKGPPPIAVPTLVDQPGLAAEAELQHLGFVVQVRHAFSRTVHVGNVLGTLPVAKTLVQPGKPVVLVVSEGPPIVVPSLAHLTLAAAERALVDAGLTVLSVHGPPSATSWTTVPPAGTDVPKGTGIALFAK